MTFDEALSELQRQAETTKQHAETGLWVAAQLRRRIEAGQLAPGSQLGEEALREALGVSRNTLREAFAALHSEHIVTRIPNRGVFVSRPNAKDIQEIYRVRRFLEPAAVLWAAPEVTTAPLTAIVRKARAAAAEGDIPGMAGANQEFHRAIVERTGSERLNGLMDQVLAEMRLVFHSMAADLAFHEPYVEDNARIAAFLESGERAAAADFLSNYLDRAEAQLLTAVGR